ncbi:MAG: hypothetical protein ACTSX9_07620 [Candidatus Njordarchaeales archaeon]
MSSDSLESVAKARKRLEETLRIIIDSDPDLLGAMLVDTNEGLLLLFVPKEEALEENIGPTGVEEEALGGTILDSFSQIEKLISEERLNLGTLEKVLIVGNKGIALLQPLTKSNSVLLLYGRKGTAIGFVYTLLDQIIHEIDELANAAFGI